MVAKKENSKFFDECNLNERVYINYKLNLKICDDLLKELYDEREVIKEGSIDKKLKIQRDINDTQKDKDNYTYQLGACKEKIDPVRLTDIDEYIENKIKREDLEKEQIKNKEKISSIN